VRISGIDLEHPHQLGSAEQIFGARIIKQPRPMTFYPQRVADRAWKPSDESRRSDVRLSETNGVPVQPTRSKGGSRSEEHTGPSSYHAAPGPVPVPTQLALFPCRSPSCLCGQYTYESVQITEFSVSNRCKQT
jgi:hypothetical protein